jgi:hypothetical protein
MATNTAGTSARLYHTDQIHYMAKNFTFANDGDVISLGFLPAGAVILKALSGVTVHVAFDAGTTNVLDIGTPANDDLYATNLALGSIAFVPLDEAVSQTVSEDTEIIATVDLTGSAATAGTATVSIAYMVPNR